MKIKREKSTSTKGHYVRNADLLPAVIEAKAGGKVTDKLMRMIFMIAERYSHKHNFVGYPFREDMVSSAVSNLCNNALKFNPERSPTPNPFSFYTTAIHNSFLQYMADEKKHRNIKDALIVEAGANPSFSYMNSDKEEQNKMSDDREIGSANHLEDATRIPSVLPNQAELPMNGTVRNPSFMAQSFSSLDPGAPGKKRLSRFTDMNPGEVKVYTPDQYAYDHATKKLTIKVVEAPKEVPPPVKKRKASKKVPKKTVRKAKAKAPRKGK